MKSSDALLAAWRRILGRAKDSPAILNTHGEVVRTFSEIDARAHDFESKIETFKAGSIIAIQIGNHEDWASILIACLRRRLVVLPLEQSISDQQRDAALARSRKRRRKLLELRVAPHKKREQRKCRRLGAGA